METPAASAPESGRTVLALRALGLGDALTGVPALRGLRRAHPGARLVIACPSAVGSLLRRHGVVDDVLDVSGLAPLAPDALVRAAQRATPGLRGRLERGVDVGVNLHGDGPQSATALAALDPVVTLAPASAVVPGGLPLDPAAHEVDRWCALVRAAGGPCGREDLVLPALARLREEAAPAERVVVLHPGAASGSRRWPAPRWAALAEHLVAAGERVVVTGTPAEGPLCAAVTARAGEDWCGRLDLPGLTEVVAAAALLVCGDTGVAHVATAARTPSVLLFGPTPPSRWGPAIDTDAHAVLWPVDDADAAPPGGGGDPHGDAVDPVLERITVADVVSAVASLAARG